MEMGRTNGDDGDLELSRTNDDEGDMELGRFTGDEDLDWAEPVETKVPWYWTGPAETVHLETLYNPAHQKIIN